MRLPVRTVVTAPDPLLTVADVKAHLRIDTPDDDALIDGLIATVTADVDGATGSLGRALGQQTIRLTGSHFPGWGDAFDWRFGMGFWPMCHADEIRLPCPPVQSVTGVTYLDPTGATVALDPAGYALFDRVLFPLGGATWPATAWRPDAVSITYVAGYGPDAPKDEQKVLPAPIRSALLLKIGALYANRDDAAAVTDLASDRLLAPWKVFA